MSPDVQETEYAYFVKIETSTGQSATVPIAFLAPKQIESVLRFDFQRLVQETGVKGARIHVESATTVGYQELLNAIATCLRDAGAKAA